MPALDLFGNRSRTFLVIGRAGMDFYPDPPGTKTKTPSVSCVVWVVHPAISVWPSAGMAVLGLVCLGWEDSRAYVTAAEAARAPVILQAGPGCRAHTPLPVLTAMFGHLAEEASVPVVIHGGSGVLAEQRKHLAASSAICKSISAPNCARPLARPFARRWTMPPSCSIASRY